MNRRSFLKGLGLAIAAVAAAPAIKLLEEEETICSGLIAQIKKNGQTVIYYDRPTIEDFERLIKTLDNEYGDQEMLVIRRL